MKRELMNWEKIFANNVIHEGIISKIKKAAHATQKPKNPIKKMSRKPIKTFLHRRHTAGQEAHEKMLNITNLIREMQIKITISYHLKLVRTDRKSVV